MHGPPWPCSGIIPYLWLANNVLFELNRIIVIPRETLMLNDIIHGYSTHKNISLTPADEKSPGVPLRAASVIGGQSGQLSVLSQLFLVSVTIKARG